MKDAFGTVIKVGDSAIYATRTGSSLYLNRGRVVDTGEIFTLLEITESTGYQKTPRKARIRVPGNIIVQSSGCTHSNVAVSTSGEMQATCQNCGKVF